MDILLIGGGSRLKSVTSEAIEEIGVAIYTDERVFKLLGILLSNRSQCCINMAEGMSLHTAIRSLKEAIVDCEIALTGAWADSKPGPIQFKLRHRKEIATGRLEDLPIPDT